MKLQSASHICILPLPASVCKVRLPEFGEQDPLSELEDRG